LARGNAKKNAKPNNASVCSIAKTLLLFVDHHEGEGRNDPHFWEMYPRTNR
jgi:hypothetical protein